MMMRTVGRVAGAIIGLTLAAILVVLAIGLLWRVMAWAWGAGC